MAEESDKKLLAAASALVSAVKELKDQIKGGDPSGSKGKAPVPKKPAVDPTRKQFQQTQSVAIQKFSDKSLMRLANAVKQDVVVDDKEAPAKEPKWWKKLIGPALLIFGGIAAFVYGLLSDSKVSGFFKIIGKVGVMGGIMLAAKLIGVAIKPVLKFLPVIGAILDLADAYFRFKKGELGQGLLSLIAGIANFVPVVGPMLSLGIGVINAFIDFNPGFLIAMGHQIFLVSFGAFTILMFLIKNNSASKTVTVFFLIPATSAVIAWIFLNEQLSLIDIFGFIVASLGVFIATRKS